MQLTDKDISHLASLSRLEVTDREREKFRDQLTSILAYVDQVAALSLPEETTDEGLPSLRLDEIRTSEATAEELRKHAPEISEDHFSVKNVRP